MKMLGAWLRPLWLVGCLGAMGCKKEEPPTPPPVVPAPTAPEVRESAAPPSEPRQEWTADVVKVERPSLKPVTLRAVREARHEGFDRVVFEFEGPQGPGYHLEYVDTPVRHCASGNEVEVAGQGWLQVRLTPAQAHEGGQVTVAERERKPGLPLLQELEITCDFEGDVTWVLGLTRSNPYRVMELHDPARLVVDMRH